MRKMQEGLVNNIGTGKGETLVPNQIQILQHLERSLDLIVGFLQRMEGDKFLIGPVSSYSRTVKSNLDNVTSLLESGDFENIKTHFKIIKYACETVCIRIDGIPGKQSAFVKKEIIRTEEDCDQVIRSIEIDKGSKDQHQEKYILKQLIHSKMVLIDGSITHLKGRLQIP